MQNTLMAELGNWNQQETRFGDLFSKDALKDREFQKMKLNEYDRLYYKYNGFSASKDERAMLVMLRFQRRKIERELYPGIITRLLRRAFSRLKHFITPKVREVKNDTSRYTNQVIPVPDAGSQNEGQKQRESGQQQQHRQIHARDIGKRLPRKNRKGRFLS